MSDISFETEFVLDMSVLDEMTEEEAKMQIAIEMKEQYESLNPFDDPETIVEVEIEIVDVCKEVEIGEGHEVESAEDVDESEQCDPNVPISRRKRRDHTWLHRRWQKLKNLETLWKITKEATVKVTTKFKGYEESARQWSKEQAKKMYSEVKKVAKKIANEVQNFAEDVISGDFFMKGLCGVGQKVKSLLKKMTFKEPLLEGLVPIASTKAPDNNSFQLGCPRELRVLRNS